MDVTAFHDHVVERRNMVHDAKHHAPHNREGQKKADRSDKQPASRTVGNVLVEKRTHTSAAKKKKQSCRRRQKNRQEDPIAVHVPVNRGWDVTVILRKRSPSLREGLPTKDLCIPGR